MSSGKVVQVIGAVIDVEFPRDSVPQVYDALMVGDKGLTLEVQQQLGDGVVRAIAMGPSEGVSRGLDATCAAAADARFSLSVLVVIEMLNALNALSEDGSLLQMPPWANPWLLVAMFVSIGLHFLILYVPWMAAIFQIVPLTYNDWVLVMAFSMPVIFIDEVLKFCGRVYQAKELAKRLKED